MNKRNLIYLKSGQSLDGLEAQFEAAGWSVCSVSGIEEARECAARGNPSVGLLLLTEEYINAQCDQLEELLGDSGSTEWVGLIKRECLEEALNVKVIPGHLYDYHTLPVDMPRLLHTLGHAWGMAKAALAATATRSAPPAAVMKMLGKSPVMRALYRDIRKIAPVDAPVMVTGESGTGKELAARAIHLESARAGGPFVAINCGALPTDLIQSELFGHEKGSFTGAHRRRIGRIEAADEGTIFLDEIGDLPLELQVNLLRFLQEGIIERVGSSEPILANAHVITATHVNLQDAVESGRFREDLYYRLNVLSLDVPPLRERKADIELLARHYFEAFVKERNSRVKGFSRRALEAMNSYHWPGNVRELVNRVRRATVMCEQRLITPVELGLEEAVNWQPMTLMQVREESERRAIGQCLERTGNNVSEAARQLGVARVTLYRLMEKYDLIANQQRDGGLAEG